MNYQELFPKVLEKTYHNHKNISTPNLPKIKIKCLFNEKNVSLPFLDIINIDKLSLKDLAGEIKSEIRISESNPKIKHLRKVLVNKGFSENEVKGHIVSKLTTKDHMWEKFHKHTRNDIRMAEKSNLELKKIDSKEELNIFYKLYLNEMRNFGTPQHSFKFFDNCLKIMKESFIGWNCYKENTLAGSIILFLSKDYAYVSYNISNRKYRKYRPNDLLYWTAIKWCINSKIHSFDMGQVDIQASKRSREDNLLKFKKKWLGEEYRRIYFRKGFSVEGNRTSLLKRFRVVWKILPKFVIGLIGPKICSRIA